MLDSSLPVMLGVASGLAMTLVWLASMAGFILALRKLPVLHSRSYEGVPVAPPFVSVIVAAKDEERNIEACVRSVLSQDHPGFELVVVNDRSTDATPTILERLRHEFAGRLTVLTIETLPEGWGGQNNAIRQGVKASRGEWLCFTDADCRWDSPKTLSTAFRDAQAHGADLFTLFPRMDAPTLWEKVYLPVCCLAFMMRLRIGDVNRADRPAAYANGAFMLVRRSTYEALGGHERVRNQLNDDIALARLAKEGGFRLRLAGNSDLYRTRMYGSVAQAWSGWTRNFYGTLQTGRRLLGALAATVGLFVVPWTGLLVFTALAALHDPRFAPAAFAWGGAVLASHLGMALIYWGFSSPVLASVLYFPAALFVTPLVGRAAVRALRRTGLLWHGARYGPNQANG
ncbi:MAG TPA: glycosyltransferase [Myxococcaceae bacterium]|nr:glycosyltransferase [Myxococcaceae bacterium]